ncbi:MAG: EamA family transporter [Nocardioidaceae bacterium]|nr:EamA family transporter [Nocardioidaceae bacterium]MCL2612601.1 EamA family transporter [Nocardioidaceae bacterium]
MSPRRLPRPPLWVAIGLVVVGVVSVQAGASIAKRIFDEVDPSGLVWLRLAVSTVVLLAIARPRLTGRSRADWITVVAFGVCLGVMNWSIYQSFARIPIGIAVTIEFLGPLAIAVIGSHRSRDLLWAALAGAGVVLLGVERTSWSWVGAGFALLAGAGWAGYILLSAGTGRRWEGLDGLSVASIVATAVVTPGLPGIAHRLGDGHILLTGAVVGLMSSVVPYSAEITALRRIRPATLGVLMSLEPAAAALTALLIVGERLGPVQWIAIACVVAASVGATRTSTSGPAPRID